MDDIVEIGQLMSLYAFAIDSKQWQLWDRVFTEDVIADYPGHRWEGLESWRADFERSHREFVVTQHLVSNLYCDVTGSTARATSQVQFQLVHDSTSDAGRLSGGAWYGDLLRRTDRGWRISERTCRVTWKAHNGGTGDPGALSSPLVPVSDAVRSGLLATFDEEATSVAS